MTSVARETSSLIVRYDMIVM